MPTDACVFCAIVAGAAPATVLATDDLAVAFLPQHVLAPGHTLVVPKAHAVDLFDVRDQDLAATMLLAKRVAGALVEELGAGGVNVFSASGPESGQSVFHLHLHVVPNWAGDGLSTWPTGRSNRVVPDGFALRIAARLNA